MAATLMSENMGGWAPGTRHYRTPDGTNLAVEAPTIPQGQGIPAGAEPMIDALLIRLGTSRSALKVVARPTVVFLCDEHGQPVDADANDRDPLTPLRVFPPGTTHDEALAELGFTVT